MAFFACIVLAITAPYCFYEATLGRGFYVPSYVFALGADGSFLFALGGDEMRLWRKKEVVALEAYRFSKPTSKMGGASMVSGYFLVCYFSANLFPADIDNKWTMNNGVESLSETGSVISADSELMLCCSLIDEGV